MADQPDEPVNLTDLPLSSRSNVPMEVQDATASTSATPFAGPTIAAPKSNAQRQREYRQRIAASRTSAQATAARKLNTERRQKSRLRTAANLALASGSLESNTASSSRSGERPSNVRTGTQQRHTMSHQPDEPVDLTDLPLPSTSNVSMEVQDAAASTSATPFAEPTIAAPKSNAQKQREYRQRIAASRTPAQAAAARKSDTERRQKSRLRTAANLALASGSLESNTASFSRSGERPSNVRTGTQQRHTMSHQPDEPVDLTDLPLPSTSNVSMEVQDAAASTSTTPFAEPTIAAPKSNAQKQREYRHRIAASRTPAQAAAARKSDTERRQNSRLRSGSNLANLALASGSVEPTTASSSRSRKRSNNIQTGIQRQLTYQQRQTLAAEPAQTTVQPDTIRGASRLRAIKPEPESPAVNGDENEANFSFNTANGVPYSDIDILLPDIKQECLEYSRKTNQHSGSLMSNQADAESAACPSGPGPPLEYADSSAAEGNANDHAPYTKLLFACLHCTFTSNVLQTVSRHELTHTTEETFSCPQCNFICKTSGYIKIHMLSHSGEKLFSCTQCNYASNRNSSLKRHSLTHTVEKLFSCTRCAYKCNRKIDFDRHILNHTGEKQFSCTHCPYTSNFKRLLNVHKLTHTGEKLFSCAHCSYACNCKAQLKSHLLFHTGNMLFSCAHCSYTCDRKSSFTRHTRYCTST